MPSIEEVNKSTVNFISNSIGNGLIAATNLQPGSVILRIRNPYILVLDNRTIETLCYHCLSRAEKLPHCARCKWVKYCCRTCQAASWEEIHKHECKIFKKLQSQGRPLLPTPVRALLQMLLRYSNGTNSDPVWSRLMSHKDAFAQQKPTWADILLQARGTVEYGGFSISMIEVAVTVLCCMKVNAFSATESDDTPIGLCFEPTMARANHSCLPNAFVSFDGRCVSLKALKTIEKGEELFISYIDPNFPLEKRQQQMEERYLFHCRCAKCTGNWNVYRTFLENPCRSASRNNVITNHEVLETRAQQLVHVSPQPFATIYDSVENLLSKISTELITPTERWKTLRGALNEVNQLSSSGSIALYPYPILLRYLVKNYSLAEEHEASLIVLLTLIFHVETYEIPEPWHPLRVTSLHNLADVLGTIYDSGGFSAQNLPVVPHTLTSQIDLLPCICATLLLVAHYTPLSHGAPSKFMEKVRQQLLFVEGRVREQRHPGGLALLEHGVLESAGREVAARCFRQLETLADINLMLRVVGSVDCAGSGYHHVKEGADQLGK